MIRFAAVLALVLTLAACDSGEGSSLYDPNATDNAAPVIASVTPGGVVLAGVDVVTITGQNFSATLADNIVVFDDAAGNSANGTILSASPTQIEVRVPNLPNAALRIRVAVVGAQNYSNAVSFPLTPAFVRFGEIGRTEIPFGIAADADGTLYVSLSNEGSSVGVQRISAEGERDPSLYFASSFPWPGLARVGDRLIGVRRLRAVFELPEGGAQRVVSAFQPTTLSLVAVTGGPDGTIYSGGNTMTLFRIAADGSTSETPFPATIRALAFANGTLYAVSGATDDAPSRVYALAVSADGSVGTPTVVGDLPTDGDLPVLGDRLVAGNAIAVAEDGTLLIGLNRMTDPIVVMSASGTTTPLYPGVIAGPVTALDYGAGSQLYMVRGASDDPDVDVDVLRIETRVNGAL